MYSKILIYISFGILHLLISGCLYRGDGVFKQVGNSDYKANINLFSMLVVTDGKPTYVTGSLFLDDYLTAIKNTHIILRSKDKYTIVANGYTDHIGYFNISGILLNESYIIEVDSSEYTAKKEIIVEPNRENWHEVIAHKR